MQMRNWLVSTVLGFSLLGGAGCGPATEEPPVPETAPEAPASEQEQQPEERTVTAMAVQTITWADLDRKTPRYVAECTTGWYNHFCSFCASNSIYYSAYTNSGCTSPSDVQHMCFTCDRQIVTYYDSVELPDGDIIEYTIEHGVADPLVVEFKLESGPDVTWWKQVSIIGGGETWRVWNQDGHSWCDWPSPSTSNCNTNSQWTTIVTDPGTRFVFSKAKGIFATHTDMYTLYGLYERLSGGDRVTFRWTRD